MPPQIPVRLTAFTTKADGKANKIITEIRLSVPCNPPSIPPDKFVPGKALWDTGATICSITREKAEEIGLTPVGLQKITSMTGDSVQNLYLLNLYLPNSIVIANVKVTECFGASGAFDFIIGMNIITLGDFSITNLGGKTTVSFVVPSMRTIDYVKELESMKEKCAGRNDPCPCGSGKKYKHCHGLS